jgi:hypothetical protein
MFLFSWVEFRKRNTVCIKYQRKKPCAKRHSQPQQELKVVVSCAPTVVQIEQVQNKRFDEKANG